MTLTLLTVASDPEQARLSRDCVSRLHERAHPSTRTCPCGQTAGAVHRPASRAPSRTRAPNVAGMEEILELAHRQGYITAAQARALGGHEHTLGRLTAQGRLQHPSRGIYLTAEERTPGQAHALLSRALLGADPFALASHHSALALHGVALFGVPWSQVHLIEGRPGSRARRGRHRHVLRDGDASTCVDGCRTVGVPLALAQVAARFGVTAGLVSLDNALATGLCRTDDVAQIVSSGRLRRGVASARRALELADGRAESPGESRLRAIIADSPWPFDVQVNVGGPGAGYVVDLLVAGLVVVEFDGAVKYAGAEGRSALVAEKVREDFIRSLGYGFMRVMWPQLDYPVTILRTLYDHVRLARAQRAGRA